MKFSPFSFIALMCFVYSNNIFIALLRFQGENSLIMSLMIPWLGLACIAVLSSTFNLFDKEAFIVRIAACSSTSQAR